jgi:cyclopropane fatty-acyl-phospholipid synthase-like methyltransferase
LEKNIVSKDLLQSLAYDDVSQHDSYSDLTRSCFAVGGKHGEVAVKDKSKIYQVVNTFYDLITDGYEWGWGASFHFSPMIPGLSFKGSQLLHESRMASFLRLKPGMQVLDV